MTFGEYMKKRRKEKGMTLLALGKKVGTGKGYLSGIESGSVPPPSEKFLRKLAKSLGEDETQFLILASYEKIPDSVRVYFSYPKKYMV